MAPRHAVFPGHQSVRGDTQGASPTAALIALCGSALVIFLDVTVVNLALPALVRQLHATTSELQWIVDAYTVVLAALVLATGTVADRVGRKGVLLVGLALFGCASLAASYAAAPAQLIAARAAMGVGAALVLPSTLSLMTSIFRERQARARAIGIWGATAGVGVATGPIASGWLLQRFWWGSVFLLFVPLTALAAIAVARTVPTSRDPAAPHIDWPGVALSTTGMALMVTAIINGANWGWTSIAFISVIAGGTALLALLVFVEGRVTTPMLDVGLFRNLRFSAAAGAVAVGYFALSGFSFVMTQYFQFAKGYPPLSAGVRFLPVAVSLSAAAVIGTRLAIRLGNKRVVSVGLSLFCLALLWTSTDGARTSYGVLVAQMLLGGSGVGLTTAPATEAIMGAVPMAKAALGAAVNDAARLFASALGVAVVGSVTSSVYASRLMTTLPRGLPTSIGTDTTGSVGGALLAAQHLSASGMAAAGQRLSDAAISSFLTGMGNGIRVAACVALVGVAVGVRWLPSRPSVQPAEDATTAPLDAHVTLRTTAAADGGLPATAAFRELIPTPEPGVPRQTSPI